MRITILALIVALSGAALWAQTDLSWEAYQKNSRATRLGYDLKMIASMNHPAPPPEALGQLVAQGLASGEFDSQEGALMVIVSMSGVLHPAAPEEFAMWEAYHPTLVAFRKQVEAMFYDADVSLRSSAHSALTALNYRPGKDRWIVDLDAAAVKA